MLLSESGNREEATVERDGVSCESSDRDKGISCESSDRDEGKTESGAQLSQETTRDRRAWSLSQLKLMVSQSESSDNAKPKREVPRCLRANQATVRKRGDSKVAQKYIPDIKSFLKKCFTKIFERLTP